jgi:hypothetical protein
MNGNEVRTGGRLCEAIRYRLVGAPEFVMQCYCRIHWDTVDPALFAFDEMYPLDVRPQEVRGKGTRTTE